MIVPGRTPGLLILIAAAAIFAGVLLWKSAREERPGFEPRIGARPSVEGRASEAAIPGPLPIASRAPEKPEATPGLAESPDAETLRREVERDPHGTPPSLTAFAENVGDRMERAKRDPGAAEALFRDLERCALQPGGATSARAFCVKSAERLNQLSGDRFSRDCEALRTRIPPEVAGLARSLE